MRTAEEIVTKYENMLFRAALHVTGSREAALDMVQETFLKWLTKRPEFESEEHEKAWLLRVVINTSRNFVSSAAERTSTELLDIYPARTEEEGELIEELMRLEPHFRTSLYLFYYEGYSVKEIAEIMGQNAVTVRSWLSRGRKRLKKQLEAEE